MRLMNVVPENDTNAPFYAQTRLPTRHGEFDVRVFRDDDGKEHLVLSVGDIDGAEGLPVRLHSECLTGEVLGSLKCDCGPQLDAALEFIQAQGLGAVVYLRQEGRGIGLGNKIRAYRLQEEGIDTVDANRMLGFHDDLRRYDDAAAMLRALGVKSVQLMTNNPSKVAGLSEAGIPVIGRLEHVTGVNEVNHGYLETKRLRMGHLYEAIPAPEDDAEDGAAQQAG